MIPPGTILFFKNYATDKYKCNKFFPKVSVVPAFLKSLSQGFFLELKETFISQPL